MRLIDADKLIEVLHESLEGDCDLREDYEFMGIDEFIENQATVYDVDKVLEQLKIEEKLAKEEKKRCSCSSTTQWEEAKGYANGISVAIDVVKGGGIDGLDKIN